MTIIRKTTSADLAATRQQFFMTDAEAAAIKASRRFHPSHIASQILYLDSATTEELQQLHDELATYPKAGQLTKRWLLLIHQLIEARKPQ